MEPFDGQLKWYTQGCFGGLAGAKSLHDTKIDQTCDQNSDHVEGLKKGQCTTWVVEHGAEQGASGCRVLGLSWGVLARSWRGLGGFLGVWGIFGGKGRNKTLPGSRGFEGFID